MNNKKKQTAVVAIATVLSVTSIASPMAVMAQENPPVPPVIMQDENGQQKTSPEIVLPENLQATAGTALEEISLPKGWVWAEKSTVITTETTEYPARFGVDDVTYDYSNIEGYNAKGHYVERMIVIRVEPEKSDPEKSEQAEQTEPVQGKANKLLEDTPTTFNAGDIVINDTNFPDKGFRDWLGQQDYGQGGTITRDEIAGITVINVSGKASIKDLTGIEHFTALTNLDCHNTGITSLDVSNNTALTKLRCSNTGITSLDVSNNTALTTLYCYNTGITSLDVSNNTALEKLECYETGINSLDVSNNKSLTYLDCSDTGITSLDVSNNIALTTLNCYRIGITNLDVSKNKALLYLYCYNTGITNLDVSNNTTLDTLYCGNRGITSIDVSYNTALTSLDCSNAGITNLDVSQNKALKKLSCYNTGITSLDVSKNPDLERMYCYSTNITSLDVSKNTALNWLECYNTGITSLDVSNTKVLEQLDCSDTPLAYLNIGTNNYLYRIAKDYLKPVNVEVTDSFSMTDKFAGIEVDKISNVKGATYSNGIMSNYSIGTPITYTYACGTSANGAETIDVTLNLIGKSTIYITEDLNKAYDGNAVSATPIVDSAGSSSTVSYKWEQKKNANEWVAIASAPTDAGTYRVSATLASDNEYPEATSAPVEFTISQGSNSWTDTLSITGWTYGASDNKPTATANFGTVDYLYSNSKNGTYTDTVPMNAGTWYVKAVVAGTDNYTGLEAVLAFTIAPKSIENNSQITVSEINNDKDVDNLVVKDGDKVLAEGTDYDYDVDKKQDGNKVTVTITFKGNYAGTITKTYTVAIDKPKDEQKNTGSVQTGDTTSLGLWSSILAFSAGIAIFLRRKKQKEETEE